MTKGDIFVKDTIKEVFDEGTMDEGPRPIWDDGTPANSIFITQKTITFDCSKGESPYSTLRPNANQSGIKEILWIYRDADNNIYNLETKYDINWWRKWCVNPYHYDKHGDLIAGKNPNPGFYYDAKGNAIPFGEKSDSLIEKDIDINKNIVDSSLGMVLTPDANLGYCYGGTVREHNLFEKCRNDIKKDPFGRRHIIDLNQDDDFSKVFGLRPCAFLTMWTVVRRNGKLYLDMTLIQRSSDFIAAGVINPTQYYAFLHMMAADCGLLPGKFTWFVQNLHIYDRHMEAAKELLRREPIECSPKVDVKVDNFEDMNASNVKVVGYPMDEIKKKNKQLKLEIAA